jgi:hypothetical protein
MEALEGLNSISVGVVLQRCCWYSCFMFGRGDGHVWNGCASRPGDRLSSGFSFFFFPSPDWNDDTGKVTDFIIRKPDTGKLLQRRVVKWQTEKSSSWRDKPEEVVSRRGVRRFHAQWKKLLHVPCVCVCVASILDINRSWKNVFSISHWISTDDANPFMHNGTVSI